MRILGNIVWLIFGGLETALGYFVSGIALCCTIIGIPFGLQLFKIGGICLWPFGSKINISTEHHGCLYVIFNIIFFFIGGIWIFLTHLLFGCLLSITILGLPWGYAHFRLAGLAFSPFGRDISF